MIKYEVKTVVRTITISNKQPIIMSVVFSGRCHTELSP